MAKILVIDDDAELRAMLRETLTAAGHTVLEAARGQEGFDLYLKQPIDLVLLDIYMPEKNGLDTLRQFLRSFPRANIIAMTGGVAKINMLAAAKRFGACDTIAKPFLPEEILALVEQTLG
jgi:DNA-binding response OmpR family regulator